MEIESFIYNILKILSKNFRILILTHLLSMTFHFNCSIPSSNGILLFILDPATEKLVPDSTTVGNLSTLPTLSYSGSLFELTTDTPTSITAITSGTITSCVASPSLPSGLTISPTNCTISGTPTTSQPATSYTITASNVNGSVDAIISIIIKASPPSLSYSGSPYTLTTHSATSIVAVTSGTITNCIASPTLPVGLTIGASNCTISGTPTTSQSATSYTITASNAHGSVDSVIQIRINQTIYAATTNGLSISKDGGTSFTNRTTTDGLGGNAVFGVYAVGSTVYAATNGGLSISNDGGNSFTNRTISNGLGSNSTLDVYAIGSTVYVATFNGLSISNNGGTSFTNRMESDGLGDDNVRGVYAGGTTVYVATNGGVSISNDGGINFTNHTMGLGHVYVNKVYAIGLNVYAATQGGLSISNDGGVSYTNHTAGLGHPNVLGIYISGTRVYAATWGGLAISNTVGVSFTNRTTSDGLGSNNVHGVYVH